MTGQQVHFKIVYISIHVQSIKNAQKKNPGFILPCRQDLHPHAHCLIIMKSEILCELCLGVCVNACLVDREWMGPDSGPDGFNCERWTLQFQIELILSLAFVDERVQCLRAGCEN